jgi:hypothetical protein
VSVLSSRTVKLLSGGALVLTFATINMVGHTAKAMRYEYKRNVLCYEDLSPENPEQFSFGSILFHATFNDQTPKNIILRKDLELADQKINKGAVIPFVSTTRSQDFRSNIVEIEFLNNLSVQVDMKGDLHKMKATLKHRSGDVQQTVQQMICTVSMYWETTL